MEAAQASNLGAARGVMPRDTQPIGKGPAMLTIKPKRSLVLLATTVGILAAAGPAGAVLYNGHAGLGASVYQHNQTDLELAAVSDGTSNTLQIAELKLSSPATDSPSVR